MTDLKGKKLLILGGNKDTMEIVREAKKLGIYTIVTDWYDTDRSPAKLIADEYWNEEVFRPDLLSVLVKENGISGVFTAYTDSYLLPYQELCERAGLSCYGPRKAYETMFLKSSFKEACKKVGVPVVPWRMLTESNYVDGIKDIDYPVAVKPVDNSGSRGVFKCYDAKELKQYCERALSFSQKKEIMVEKLMDVNSEFSAYYIIHKGIATLASMGDRYVEVVNENLAPQAKGMFFPSRHLNQYIAAVDEKVKDLFKTNNMNEGFVFVQGFIDNDQLYLNEIGYRLNGGFTYKFNEFYNKYNQVHLLLEYALTGKMDEKLLSLTDPHFKGLGLLLTISLKEGRIAKVEGIDEIKQLQGVYDFVPVHFVGDDLRGQGTSTQIFGYGFCVAESLEVLNEVVNRVREKLVVEDEDGVNMLLGILDVKQIKY